MQTGTIRYVCWCPACTNRLCSPLSSSWGLAALFKVHPGTAQLCDPGYDCCQNSSAVGKGCVEKLRRLPAGPVVALRPLLLALGWATLKGWECLSMCHVNAHSRTSLPDLGAASSPQMCLVVADGWLTLVILTSLIVWIPLFQVSDLLCQQEDVQFAGYFKIFRNKMCLATV